MTKEEEIRVVKEKLDAKLSDSSHRIYSQWCDIITPGAVVLDGHYRMQDLDSIIEAMEEIKEILERKE